MCAGHNLVRLMLTHISFSCRENSTNLEKFHLKIKQNELYAEDEPLVDILIHEMATKPISHVRKYRSGIRTRAYTKLSRKYRRGFTKLASICNVSFVGQ